MSSGKSGIDVASDLLKQLVTLNTVVVAAVLSLVITDKTNPVGHGWAVWASIFGGLSIFLSLLFLTDLAAHSLGFSSHQQPLRKKLFISSWASFFGCIGCAACYVFLITGVV